MATVLMKSNAGRVSFAFDTPNGKKHLIDFKPKEEGGDCVAEVPVEVEYVDDFNHKHLFHKNYAQHLLNSYDYLEVISVKETPVVAEAVEKRTKKGKQT